jgi:hypothetical protein
MRMNATTRRPLVPEDINSEQHTAMDPATQVKWDAWADARARAIVRDYTDMVVQVIGEETGLDNRKFQGQIIKLRAQLTLLRSEVRAAVERLSGKDAGAPASKKRLARRRD